MLSEMTLALECREALPGFGPRQAVGLVQSATRLEWTYLYGSVEPITGRTHGCRLPEVSTVAMNSYLTDFSKQLPANEHALMVLDGAAWHKAVKLEIPKNITLVVQPPYSPELNPMELVWGNGRRHYFSIGIMKRLKMSSKPRNNSGSNKLKVQNLCNLSVVLNG